MGEMRALSIIQPWADAIALGTKRVENRSWKAPPWAYGQRIAIHASEQPDLGARLPPGEPWPIGCTYGHRLGAVVAVATLAGCHWPPAPIRAFTRAGRPCSPDSPCSPWGVPDQIHWELEDVVALAGPVPCGGKLSLWRLPDDVEKAVREQLEDSHA